MNQTRSQELFNRSQKLMPGGVNSPVRSFNGVGGVPPFIAKGLGSKVWDVDGNEYLDFLGSWGPLILGHANPVIVDAIRSAALEGTSFGAPTEKELLLAELISTAIPSIEMLRLVSSGTEATMSAIRIARAYTNRNKLIKFNGNYHGHSDGLLVKAGSGAATHGVPTSAGVPASYASETLVAEFNDLNSVVELIDENINQIAAIIVEPIAGNMGVVKPRNGFLQGLRKLCDQNGILLIFDEVITGFRVSYGGAQNLYGVSPDLTCLGKIIGGGLPVGAYGGKREIMKMVSPLGPSYQAGTLSGNPLAVSAGIACLSKLSEPKTYEALEALGARAEEGLYKAAALANLPIQINRVGSMFTVFFANEKVCSWAGAAASDTSAYSKYFHHLLDSGIYVAPSQFECGFVSLAHTQNEIDTMAGIAKIAFSELTAN
ncbi:MAG: glutamate-1-semialdehyde 2,1-aminomutase [Dehalococcoidia bacterium]|nr:glutamate-1-semialdehyde 2,1-aminomutase [Dehalococcoidia bacterium]|tara:strand:- start:3300 stop:4592 length:1293 start_codon:yes stop_codon:yes gene_type:complete